MTFASRTATAFAAGLMIAGPVSAVTTVQLLDRQVTQSYSAFGGTGPARIDVPCSGFETSCSVNGSVGSATAVGQLGTPLVAIGGTAGGTDADLVFSATLTADWATSATYSFGASGSDVVLSASGSHASNLAVTSSGITTFSAASRNWQAFSFTLDADTAFTLTGQVDNRYNPLSLLWTPDGVNWYGMNIGATTQSTQWLTDNGPFSYSFAGTLPAGLFELSTLQLAEGGGEGALVHGYGFSLTLHDAIAAPVPEPATWAMLALGLSVLLLSRRGALAARR